VRRLVAWSVLAHPLSTPVGCVDPAAACGSVDAVLALSVLWADSGPGNVNETKASRRLPRTGGW